MIEGLKPYAESAKTKPMTRTSLINVPWLTAIPADGLLQEITKGIWV